MSGSRPSAVSLRWRRSRASSRVADTDWIGTLGTSALNREAPPERQSSTRGILSDRTEHASRRTTLVAGVSRGLQWRVQSPPRALHGHRPWRGMRGRGYVRRHVSRLLHGLGFRAGGTRATRGDRGGRAPGGARRELRLRERELAGARGGDLPGQPRLRAAALLRVRHRGHHVLPAARAGRDRAAHDSQVRGRLSRRQRGRGDEPVPAPPPGLSLDPTPRAPGFHRRSPTTSWSLPTTTAPSRRGSSPSTRTTSPPSSSSPCSDAPPRRRASSRACAPPAPSTTCCSSSTKS